MTKAFCPGHITCFFHPVRTDDVLTTGSKGAGIRISKGATVTLEERSDNRVNITMDGESSDARVTRKVLELVRPGEGFDVTIENDLPVSQGFGMSAAGAIAVALAALGEYSEDCFRYAHMAEVMEGGGLGDVTALMCKGHQPIRLRAGFPPEGWIEDSGLRFDNLSLVVFGDKMDTGSVLNDPATRMRMENMDVDLAYMQYLDATYGGLFVKGRQFSREVGLEPPAVTEALDYLEVMEPAGFAAMCMLGNSIFSDIPAEDLEFHFEDAQVYSCSSTDEMPHLL